MSGLNRQQQQAELLHRARMALQNDHAAEAERLANEILSAQPGHLEAGKIAAYAMLMQGRAGEALAPLERIARSSRDPEVETQLAIALRQAGRAADALIWLKRAIKRKPAFPAAFHEYGFVLNSLRRFDEAIAVLRQGIEAAPMMTAMRIQLGHVYYASLDRDQAENTFADALAINPDHPEAIHGLGSVLIDKCEYARAAELFQHALAVNQGDTDARLGLANCMLELGQSDVAYACLRAATARGPQYYGIALNAVSSSGHGRFWLRPSDAAKFFKGERG